MYFVIKIGLTKFSVKFNYNPESGEDGFKYSQGQDMVIFWKILLASLEENWEDERAIRIFKYAM